MSFATTAVRLAETAPLPDRLTRAGIAVLVERSRRHLARRPEEEEARLLAEMEKKVALDSLQPTHAERTDAHTGIYA